MGTINMFQLPSHPTNFSPLFFSPYSYYLLICVPNLYFPLSFVLFLLCHPLLVIPRPFAVLRRQRRPVCLMSWTSCLLFCWQPYGLFVLETAWHCWDSGCRTSFHRFDTFHNVTYSMYNWISLFPATQLKISFTHMHIFLLTRQQHNSIMLF